MPNQLMERGYIDMGSIPINPDGSFPSVLDFGSEVAPNTHLFVIDDFIRQDMDAGDPPTHGDTVTYVATQGLPGNGAQINIATGDGEIQCTTDMWMAALAVTIQELGYNQTGNAIINVSLEGSMRGPAGTYLSDADYKANIEMLLRQYAEALDAIGEINPAALERIALVTIAGNGNPSGVDISDVMSKLRSDFPRVFPPGPSGGGDHLLVVGGTIIDSNSIDKGMNYSNTAGDLYYAPADDVVVDANGGTLDGTSFAAPFITNLLQQVLIANPGMTVGQVTKALKLAYISLGRVPTAGELTGELRSEPVITIDDAGTIEGDEGTTTSLAFSVRLSEPTANTVTVRYSTASGSAGSADFAFGSGTVTFGPGEQLKPIRVTVYGDDIQESDEFFYVNLSSPSGAVLADAQAKGSIFNDDTAGITVSPTSGLSTTEDGGTASFTVVLNTKPSGNVTIPISSSDTTEGRVSVSSLTFTSKNWNTPRTVTVTGLADTDQDGDVAYTIITGPAASGDQFYGGLNASDVSVINRDRALLARWSVSVHINAAGYSRTYSGNVSIPIAGGSASFSSNGASFTVTSSGSMLTVSGSGFGGVPGASAWGSASGSGGITESATSFSASGGISGTLHVTYDDGSTDTFAISGSFTASAPKP